ncbi:MAG: Hpt domain-containing protein, partial [Flavisolibacter sp.]
MIGEKEKCIQLGMNDYVSKPLKETVLYNLIAKHAKKISDGNTNNPIVVNLDYLHELSGNDKNFEKEIMQQFLEQVPIELDQLKESINVQDYKSIRRMAHSLKSTVGYVGLAEELHPYLDMLEENASLENNNDMLNEYESVKEKCYKAMDEVRIMLDNHLV